MKLGLRDLSSIYGDIGDQGGAESHPNVFDSRGIAHTTAVYIATEADCDAHRLRLFSRHRFLHDRAGNYDNTNAACL